MCFVKTDELTKVDPDIKQLAQQRRLKLRCDGLNPTDTNLPAEKQQCQPLLRCQHPKDDKPVVAEPCTCGPPSPSDPANGVKKVLPKEM